MTTPAIESRPTSPLTWIALAVGCVSLVYVPLLFGNQSSNLLMKLGLIRKLPVAAVVALVYGLSVAVLDKKGGGKVSGPVIATIAISGLGTIADLAALFIAFSHGGAGP
jgi:hypothetical protein